MSTTLKASGLAAGHGARALFSDLDLVIGPGDVVGLVGANGAGKSTLLRLLAGEAEPEDGTVTLTPAGASVGHLPQEPERRDGETVAGFIGRRTGVAAAEAAMNAAAEALADAAPGADDRYSAALESWLALGGADLDERSAVTAASLGLGVDLTTAMTALSGGQAARAGLAALLLSRYDVLLLDEPTNDLDLDGLERLEQFVSGLRSPAVIISHDREFLARTVTRVVELDLAQQQVAVYEGGYDSYLAEREVARRHAREAYEEYADTRSGLEQRARMQRDWATVGVKNARRKKADNDKFVTAFKVDSAEKQAAKAKQTDRMLERLEVVEEPRKEWELRMTIAAAPRSGSVVASASRAVVRRGAFTLGPVDVQVDWADRVVITGANGSGKTTLLGVLLGTIAVDEGSAGLGSSVRLGEVDQARALFHGPQTLARAFGEARADWPDAEVRTLLAKFGLGAEHVHRAAESLSPGERTRAALALLQAREVNLLVLDEPTNHLDLPAIEQLEQALDSFGGTVLLVTHDRRMLADVNATRRWHVEDGRLTEI
ncbi:ABC-F family ATP-binding cassette domain-containing protein [Phycicoccus sp. Root101]|uniref:ABC-F family ATP-binding cassette domain-containing protein n=1 Tax=Phycicoccus sp. Root101 TaxID=1736421 RepID=UPI000703C180|nr:ABC-F family ATP-binding cassette domain-containing protein [Phycicoccus sp. Root101]KQU65240.1 heme ABC transporter ATP-binding protein [Phycicoccus sp. Root101]